MAKSKQVIPFMAKMRVNVIAKQAKKNRDNGSDNSVDNADDGKAKKAAASRALAKKNSWK